MKYVLTDEYIELFKLLKVLDLVDSGANAKFLIADGHVLKNAKVETKKRAKIRKGDIIEVADVKISVE